MKRVLFLLLMASAAVLSVSSTTFAADPLHYFLRGTLIGGTVESVSTDAITVSVAFTIPPAAATGSLKIAISDFASAISDTLAPDKQVLLSIDQMKVPPVANWGFYLIDSLNPETLTVHSSLTDPSLDRCDRKAIEWVLRTNGQQKDFAFDYGSGCTLLVRQSDGSMKTIINTASGIDFVSGSIHQNSIPATNLPPITKALPTEAVNPYYFLLIGLAIFAGTIRLAIRMLKKPIKKTSP